MQGICLSVSEKLVEHLSAWTDVGKLLEKGDVSSFQGFILWFCPLAISTSGNIVLEFLSSSGPTKPLHYCFESFIRSLFILLVVEVTDVFWPCLLNLIHHGTDKVLDSFCTSHRFLNTSCTEHFRSILVEHQETFFSTGFSNVSGFFNLLFQHMY